MRNEALVSEGVTLPAATRTGLQIAHPDTLFATRYDAIDPMEYFTLKRSKAVF